MEPREEIERFRALVMEMGLPHHEMTHFGLRCPYCGKSDRIHRLEPPGELVSFPADYGRMWKRFGQGGALVVCTFCRQLLRFHPAAGNVSPLAEVS
jgi:hypothetical protein